MWKVLCSTVSGHVGSRFAPNSILRLTGPLWLQSVGGKKAFVSVGSCLDQVEGLCVVFVVLGMGRA